MQNKKRKNAVLKIEIDKDLYERYKKIVKEKNQMLKGYNNSIFLKAIEDEIDKAH